MMKTRLWVSGRGARVRTEGVGGDEDRYDEHLVRAEGDVEVSSDVGRAGATIDEVTGEMNVNGGTYKRVSDSTQQP